MEEVRWFETAICLSFARKENSLRGRGEGHFLTPRKYRQTDSAGFFRGAKHYCRAVSLALRRDVHVSWSCTCNGPLKQCSHRTLIKS